MSRKLLLALAMVLLTACATTTKTYNVPFVDIEETIELSIGLDRDEVLDLMGNPLYVEFGNSETDQIFWVYEVRAKEVKSGMGSNMQPTPNKIHKKHKPSEPIHKLKLEFRDDRLYRWAPIDEFIEEETLNQSKDTEKSDQSTKSSSKKEVSVMPKKKSRSFFFQPQLAIYNIAGLESDNIAAFFYGGFFGLKQDSGKKIGISLTGEFPSESRGEGTYDYYGEERQRYYYNYFGGMSIMAQYENPNFRGLVLTTGAGFTFYEWSDYGEHGEAFGFAKLAIGKKFNIGPRRVIPQLEFIVGTGSFMGISVGLEL